MKRTLIALEILLILLIGGFLALIYSGWYNIAATNPDYGLVKWTLETAMERSVKRHAREIAAPVLETLDQQEGLRHFDEMCVLCHGAPGVEPSEIGKGQNPEPPDLAKVVHEWVPSELFWIVRHGIKMTGMPGFGPTHDDDELWAVVAFIRRLPDISPAEYRKLVEPLRSAPPGPGREGHPHEHSPEAPGTALAGGGL